MKKVQSSKFKVQSYRKATQYLGFTLIEILVVVALIGIVSIVTSQIFFTVLRSQAKSEITKEVKQNGDYALSVMEQMTRNASDLDCNTSGKSFKITNANGNTTTFDFNGTQIASISATTQYLTNSSIDIATTPAPVINVICPTPPTSPKYVYINFTLTQHGPTGSPQQNASETFQTTVSLRNYQ